MWLFFASASAFVVPLGSPRVPLRRSTLFAPSLTAHQLAAQRHAALRLAMSEDLADGAAPPRRDQPRDATPYLVIVLGALAGFAGPPQALFKRAAKLRPLL